MIIKNLENHLKTQYYDMSENDMIEEWLNHSNETTRYFPKPTVDKHTVTFVMYSCEKLEVERDVFFMTIDVIGKYLEIARIENIELKEPILTVLVLILICNKHTGQRSDLSCSTILSFMRKEGWKKYNLSVIQNTEKTIMMNLKCHIPLLSTMDDLNVLIEVFIKQDQFVNLIRKQCLDVLNIFYLNSKTITELLDEIYSKSKKTKLLKMFYDRKLYFPAGILLCVLKVCKHIKLFDYNDTSDKISNYTKIPSKDLNLLSSLIFNLLHSLRCNK